MIIIYLECFIYRVLEIKYFSHQKYSDTSANECPW
jgi:hypothetical protein